MPTLASFLLGIVGPLAVKVLIALGVGTVTFTGVTAAFAGVVGIAQSNWGGVSSDVLQLASLAGIPEALGIVVGAMTTRVAIWAAASATKFVLSPAA